MIERHLQVGLNSPIVSHFPGRRASYGVCLYNQLYGLVYWEGSEWKMNGVCCMCMVDDGADDRMFATQCRRHSVSHGEIPGRRTAAPPAPGTRGLHGRHGSGGGRRRWRRWDGRPGDAGHACARPRVTSLRLWRFTGRETTSWRYLRW